MSPVAPSLAMTGAVVGVLLLIALHAIRPELDPALHVISEYALGPTGWLMALCFAALAVSCAAQAAALRHYAAGRGARIGLGLLGLAAIGLLLAAAFPIDPLGTPPAQMSVSAQLHEVGSMLGIPSLAIAAVLLSRGLRRDPRWAAVRRALHGLAHLGWLSLVAMFVCLAVLMQQGADGIGGWIGWANRLLVVAYAGWLFTAASPLVRAGRADPLNFAAETL